jgi:CHAT domain-containing protein/tetratricopeptide (TPR) repeat protein
MNRLLCCSLALAATLPCAAAEIPASAREAIIEAKQDGRTQAQNEASFQRALDLLPGDAHRQDREAIHLELADIEVARGRYASAIAIDQAVVEEASAAGDAEMHARALDRQGYAYRELGDFAKSLEAHNQSLQVANSIADPYLRGAALARALNLSGSVEIRVAEEAGWQYDDGAARLGFERAVKDLEDAIATAKPLVPLIDARPWRLQEFLEITPKTRLSWIGGTLSNAQLSLFELRLRNPLYLARAEESSWAAVTAAAEGSDTRASALHFYARVLAREKRYDEALKALDEAQAIWLKHQPPFYRLAYAYQVRADEVYTQIPDKGDLALEYYDKARAVHLRYARCNDVAALDYLAGRTLEQLGRKPEAMRRYIASVELYERLRVSLNEKERLEFFATRLRPYGALIRLLYESWRSTGNSADGELAFAYSERSRARSLLDTLQAAQPQAAAEPAGSDQDLCEAAKLPKVDLKTAEHAGLDTAITVAKVSSVMRPGDLLLEYFIGEDAAYAFVLAKGRLDIVPLATSKRDLTPRLKALNKPFEDAVRGDDGRGPSYKPLEGYDLVESHQLYHLLLEPVAPSVRQAERLIVVPHRSLFYLPFEALVSDLKTVQPGDRTPSRFQRVEYFLDRAPPTRYALSASVLYLVEKSGATGGTSGKVLAILNPPTPGRGLSSLAGFEQIWTPLAKQFKPVVDGRGPLGTPELFFRESGSSEFVVLGVHGVFQEESPLQSRMLLAGGDVTAQDILKRAGEDKKIAARLFTLAACQLGRGQLREGEGIVGMTRVLQIAGAQRIVAALWHVDVKPTTDLMVSFYQQIAKGGESEVEKALRDAKRAVRTESTPQNIPVPFAHPFFWGAFVMD